MGQLRPGSSHELFPRVTQDRAEPVVHLEPPLRRRRDAGPDQGHVEVAPESRLGLPQPRLRRPPFRDVLDGAGPDRVAVLEDPWRGLPPDPPDLFPDGEPPFPAERTVMGERVGVGRRETLPIRRDDEVGDAPGVRAESLGVDFEELAETRRHELDPVGLVDGGSPGPGLRRRRTNGREAGRSLAAAPRRGPCRGRAPRGEIRQPPPRELRRPDRPDPSSAWRPLLLVVRLGSSHPSRPGAGEIAAPLTGLAEGPLRAGSLDYPSFRSVDAEVLA